jgi:hypothetical protein
MYKRSDIQERAESILKTESGKNYANPLGLVGFILSAVAFLGVVAIFLLNFFKIIPLPDFKGSLYLYVIAIGCIIFLVVAGFIFSAIGAIKGYKIEKKRMVSANVMLCVMGMAVATFTSIFTAITFICTCWYGC